MLWNDGAATIHFIIASRWLVDASRLLKFCRAFLKLSKPVDMKVPSPRLEKVIKLCALA